MEKHNFAKLKTWKKIWLLHHFIKNNGT